MNFSRIAESHYQPLSPLGRCLLPLAAGYGGVVRGREWLYGKGLRASVEVSVPVVSIGNLTTGGTGKTPVILELAHQCLAQGRRVVILSRGYGATEPLDYGQPRHAGHGDEAFYLQEQLPDAVVIVGRNRAANARRAVAEHQPDVLLLDDGFQYLPLRRDFNIVLVDGERLFGNGALLPVGPLREPLSALRRADALWLTKAVTPDAVQRLQALLAPVGLRDLPVCAVPFRPQGFYSVASGEVLPPDALAGQTALLLSGIAQPEGFVKDVEALGVSIQGHGVYGDHHAYTAADVARLTAQWEAQAPSKILTTEKDWVKLQALLPAKLRPFVYTLRVAPALDALALLPEVLG